MTFLPYNPTPLSSFMSCDTNKDRRVVWASAFSLAATYAITIVFFSSGY